MRRVDADEVTYWLHIILRFELERGMLTGDIDLEDLPEAFDAKMREYLGLQPPDVVTGVLQDVHWSDMTHGLLPDLCARQRHLRPAVGEGGGGARRSRRAVRARRVRPLREWLRENVHRHGRAFTPQELLVRVTGSSIDPAPYLRYLERKLGDSAARRLAVL